MGEACHANWSNVYKIILGIPQGKRQVWKTYDNIKIDINVVDFVFDSSSSGYKTVQDSCENGI